MQHKKLIDPLKKLSPDQMDRLSDFIHSPYFNTVDTIASLFDYLKHFHPNYTDENTSNNAIAKAIKCSEDEKWIAKRISRLLDLTEKFLSMEYASDPVMERIGVIKAYKKLQLPKHLESTANELRKELKNQPFRDFDHLWRMHKLEEEAFEGFDKVIVRTAENPADDVLETLKKFYLTKKLRYMTDAVTRERFLGVTNDDRNKKEVTDFIEKSMNEADLYLLIYGNIYLMNLEKDANNALKYYKQLKTVVKSFSEYIPDEELRSICVHLQNHCLKLINAGNKDYLREFFEIIDFRILKNILLEEGRINPQLYKNIAGVAIMLNENDWANNFINSFKEKLPGKLRSDYYHLAMGQLLYHQKDYITASKHLSAASHNRSDVYFGFSVKKLLLKIGFESNDSPLILESYMNAYRKHLERYRSKIGESASILEKFVKYFRYLEKARFDASEMEILLNSLIEEENFSDRDWLIKMAQTRLKKASFKLQSPSAA